MDEIGNLSITTLIANAAGIFATLAAWVAVWMSVRENARTQRRERFVRWCEEPTRLAVEAFCAAVTEGIAKKAIRATDKESYQGQTDFLQASVRNLQNRILIALAIVGSEYENQVIEECYAIEDEMVKNMLHYRMKYIDDIDIGGEARRRSQKIIGAVLASDPSLRRRERKRFRV